MSNLLGKVWKPIATSETVEGGVETAKAVFELAKTLNEQKNNNSQITKLVEKIPTLLEALNSPIGQVLSSSLPFISLSVGLIKFIKDLTEEEPSIPQCVLIISQAAYLKSIEQTLALDTTIKVNNDEASDKVQKQIRKLSEKEINIDDSEARAALINFHQSKLAKAFNNVFSLRMKEANIANINENDLNIIIEKIAINTNSFIKEILAEGGENIQKLIDWLSMGGAEDLEKHIGINYYLEQEIRSLRHQEVFEEKFTFQQIYVSLKAIQLDSEGKNLEHSNEFILDNWVQKNIRDPEKENKVIFIQAAPGRGKSVFCRMFADWVSRKFYPIITPILIKLRDIESFGSNFAQTLTDALSHYDFVNNDRGWLTDRKTKYLFLLDGFDELLIEGRTTNGIQKLIEQVSKFQEKYGGQEAGHRVILTGRPMALQGINNLPDNLERINILPMDDEIQSKWFNKWKKVAVYNDISASSKEAKAFKKFLTAKRCPDEIKYKLAKEPLLLFMLAKLHREEEIKQEFFEKALDSTQAKILIYEKSLEWVLKKQRTQFLNTKLTGLKIDGLNKVLVEAGLCVIQSGGEYAKLSMIESRLIEEDQNAVSIIQKLREQGTKALNTALGAFYLRPSAEETEGGVEFYHKSFSEFLCAKRMQISLEQWSAEGAMGQTWLVTDLSKQIYSLLGYGGLTPEIIEYLFGLLAKSKLLNPINLFNRLENFYFQWINGKFIDSEVNTPAQNRMTELREQLPPRAAFLGQRQVDMFTGLNVMILLLELHRYGQKYDELREEMNFHPCGKCNSDGELEDDTVLLKILNLSSCLGKNGFLKTVGCFLYEANLSNVYLSHCNLSGINLRKTNLSGAKLRQICVTDANLSGAILDNCDMCRCDLTSSNLNDARLTNAYLRGADCREAKFNRVNLNQADLCRAYLYNADFKDAILTKVSVSKSNLDSANFQNANFDNMTWDMGTQWFNARGLHEAINVPVELEKNSDFAGAKKLSKAFQKLFLGQISEALRDCQNITDEIAKNKDNKKIFKSHIYNRFAWLACLYNENNICSEEIVDLAEKAVSLNNNNGNYKDTYAVALVLNTKIEYYIPLMNTIADDEYRETNRENPYQKPINLFKQVLRSEDFHKLALPTKNKLRQRRKDWIKKLKNKENPFTPEVISLLRKEEY